MKLSEMSTDRLCDALCLLTEPFCTLAEDVQVQEALNRLLTSGLTRLPAAKAWGMLMGELTPLLLCRHRAETLCIAAVLLDQPVEKLRAQSGLATIAALCDCWEDELADFFACAADTVGKPC